MVETISAILDSPRTDVLLGIVVQTVMLGGFLLKQNRVWTLLKERMDGLWWEYCRRHGIPYTALEKNQVKGD